MVSYQKGEFVGWEQGLTEAIILFETKCLYCEGFKQLKYENVLADIFNM